MRAARYYGLEDVRVEDNVPEPELKPGQVKIKPAFVGICGTDLHEYLGGPNFCPVNAHPVTGETIPITLGHEFSGTITDISPDVKGFQVGQLCAIQPTIFCGKCNACDAGAPNVCSSGGFVGLSGGGGGLSDAVCVNATHVLPLPDGVSLDIGALVEPLAVAWHATTAAPKMGPDTFVLVIGGGPIGLAMILCLKAQGVKNIFVSEVASSRQKFAKAFGAVRVIDPSKEDARAIVLDATARKGADVAFDCAGVPASIKTACQSVCTKGTVVNIAIWEREIPFNPNWVTWNESTFKSVLGYNRVDFESVIKHIGQGTIKPAEMITAKIKLDNIVKDGIQSLIKDKDKHVKILVDMAA